MTLAALVAIVLFAFTTEAAIGFGSTVITVTLGAQLLPIEQLLPAFVPVNMILSTWIVARHHREVDAALLFKRFLPWMILGVIPGLLLLRLQNTMRLRLGFALFVVALAAIELARMRRAGTAESATKLAPPVAAGVLIVGGVVHGLFGSGGPMAVYVAGRSGLSKGAFRATLSTLWLLLNVVLMTNFATMHRLGRASATLSLELLAPMLVALGLGAWLHDRIAQGTFRVAIYALLLVAGLALAARSF